MNISMSHAFSSILTHFLKTSHSYASSQLDSSEVLTFANQLVITGVALFGGNQELTPKATVPDYPSNEANPL